MMSEPRRHDHSFARNTSSMFAAFQILCWVLGTERRKVLGPALKHFLNR